MAKPDLPLTYQIDEEESGIYTGLLTGNDRVTPVPGSVLQTLTLTLYVVKQDGTEQIVNSRDGQSILNTNGGAVLDTPVTRADGTQYNLSWTITPADTTIIEPILRFERHIGLIEWTAPNGVSGKQEIILNVRNLRRVS